MGDEYATKADVQALSKRLTQIAGALNKVTLSGRAYVDKADNQQTATLEKEYLTKKELQEVEKVMDAVEKRHAQLVQTQTGNYAKKFKGFVVQEFAKVGKGKR